MIPDVLTDSHFLFFSLSLLILVGFLAYFFFRLKKPQDKNLFSQEQPSIKDELSPVSPIEKPQQEQEAGAIDEILQPEITPQPAKPEFSPDVDLTAGLKKTKEGFLSRLGGLFQTKEIPLNLLAQIEEILLTSDLGIKTTESLLEKIKSQLNRWELKDEKILFSTVQQHVDQVLQEVQTPWHVSPQKPHLILMVGVNGVGKTTSIGKLAAFFRAQNLSVMVAAGDTFRAAAAPQLKIWAERTDSRYFAGTSNKDPASVIYEACEQAKKENVDVILADTAGRLHTKTNLMDELKKIKKVATKVVDHRPPDVFLVVDATTGQNAVAQAKEFHEAVGLTGIILTKLDGTAKGGVVVAIAAELKIPIRFVGVGEGIHELKFFDAHKFAQAIFT